MSTTSTGAQAPSTSTTCTASSSSPAAPRCNTPFSDTRPPPNPNLPICNKLQLAPSRPPHRLSQPNPPRRGRFFRRSSTAPPPSSIIGTSGNVYPAARPRRRSQPAPHPAPSTVAPKHPLNADAYSAPNPPRHRSRNPPHPQRNLTPAVLILAVRAGAEDPMISSINLLQSCSGLTDLWSPKVVGQVNEPNTSKSPGSRANSSGTSTTTRTNSSRS